jgi:hypothetical protein
MSHVRPTGVFACLLLLAFASCGGKQSTEGPIGESHWLRECTSDVECAGDGSCLCGRCTIACSDSCGAGPAGTQCIKTSTCSTPLGGACLQSVPDAGPVDSSSDVSADARVPFDASVQPEAGDGSDQVDADAGDAVDAADAATDDGPEDARPDDGAIRDAPLDQSAIECKETYAWEEVHFNGDFCLPAACFAGASLDAATPCGMVETCVGSEWCVHRSPGTDVSWGWDAADLDRAFYSCHPPADFTCSGGMCCLKDCNDYSLQFHPSERMIRCPGV